MGDIANPQMLSKACRHSLAGQVMHCVQAKERLFDYFFDAKGISQPQLFDQIDTLDYKLQIKNSRNFLYFLAATRPATRLPV